jgi:hypothetical protein
MTNGSKSYWIGYVPYPGCASQRMVHYRVSTPYLSPTHSTKVTTQSEAVDIAMRLEATPRGVETLAALAQVQSKLANLIIHLQDMAKVKVLHEHVWCTTCHS